MSKASDCPDFAVMGSFIDPASGGLPEPVRLDVARHVNRCRSCWSIVQSVSRDLGRRPPAGVVDKVERKVKA